MSNSNQQPKSLRPNIPLPKGTEYHRCTAADSWGGKPWCSIQVDINGEHVTSNPLLAATWGYCSDSCTRDCETDCNACDLVKKDKCTECGNGKYLTPAGKCETGCPDGLIRTGTLAAGRSCQQKYSRRLVAATKFALSDLGASTFTTKLATNHKVAGVLLNATAKSGSNGTVTGVTAMLGKSSDSTNTKITWFKPMRGGGVRRFFHMLLGHVEDLEVARALPPNCKLWKYMRFRLDSSRLFLGACPCTFQ